MTHAVVPVLLKNLQLERGQRVGACKIHSELF